MNCAEFHKLLPGLIESGSELKGQKHLQECDRCSSLVSDLTYIAEQAKLLLPMRDPSPKVWSNIQQSLEREGLAKSSRLPHLAGLSKANRGWGAVAWAGALAAMLVLSFGLLTLRKSEQQNTAQVANTADQAAGPQAADLQTKEDDNLLAAVGAARPAVRPMYADSLKSVNAYISEAAHNVQENPSDNDAHTYLQEAYAQKAMLYQMAAETGE